MKEAPAANPVADEPVNLDAARNYERAVAAETGSQAQEAQTPAGGESDDLDQLTKEALGEPEANPEFIEVEIDGKTYKVLAADGQPVDPDLKFGALRDADYRQKTMALSDEKKAVQQEREVFKALANLKGDAAMRATNLQALDAQIRQLSSISIDDLVQQGYTDADIAQAQAHLNQLQQNRQNLAHQVGRDIHVMREVEGKQLEQARMAARKEAAIQDKALTPERIEALEQFAETVGFDKGAVQSISTATEYQVLHWAKIGKEFIERQRNAANLKAAAAGNPARTLGGVKAGGKSPEDMSVEEYAAWRQAGNG